MCRASTAAIDPQRQHAMLCVCVPQVVDKSGLSVSWGVPFVLAAAAMIIAGVVIGFRTVKGE